MPDASALATGRSLLARGHCNPTYYLAGALVEQLRVRMAPDRNVAYLTAGSCGPCRYATYPASYRRALATAGFGEDAVAVLDQLAPRTTQALAEIGVPVTARLLAALARAIVLGDVLVKLGCTRRPTVTEPAAVDALIAKARSEFEDALAHGSAVMPVIGAFAEKLAALPTRSGPPPVRVRLVGEFFASTTDGHGSYEIVRWLERRGALVTPPAVTEWLLYLAWQAAREARDETPPFGNYQQRDATRGEGLARALRAFFQRTARAAGVTIHLPDMDDLGTLAAPHYSPALRGGAGHLELGALLEADRDGTADLVVSIKPFGCLPASAVSDGVATVVARRTRCAFVAIETTGDGEAQVHSRLELALEMARARRASSSSPR